MNRIVSWSCLLLLLTGYAAPGNDVLELDVERVYEIAKSEIIARHPDLVDGHLREGEITYTFRPNTTIGPKRDQISVTFDVMGSEKTNTFIRTREVVTVTMNPQGKLWPPLEAVKRTTLADPVLNPRIEPTKRSGDPGKVEARWKNNPLESVLVVYANLSQKIVVPHHTVPLSMPVDAETGEITEAEFLELIEVLLKKKGVHLEHEESGVIRAFYQDPANQ